MNESTDVDAVLNRYFGVNKPKRMVGPNRNYCSGYNNILRFFGSERVDPDQINLIHKSDEFRFEDDTIAVFAAKYEQELRSQGRLKDGPYVTRLAQIVSEAGSLSMIIQRATYGQFAGSCFCLDREDDLFGEHGSLRKYYLSKRKSTGASDNPLASCFGVSGLVLVEEMDQIFILRVRRSGHLATMAGTYGASVAGVVDYDEKYGNLWEMTQSALIQEIEEEIDLRKDEYLIHPLAYAHELYRGEHPQLFCLVNCHLSREELSGRLAGIEEEHKEFDMFDFVPFSDEMAHHKNMIEQFNFEGKMSYYLTEECLRT